MPSKCFTNIQRCWLHKHSLMYYFCSICIQIPTLNEYTHRPSYPYNLCDFIFYFHRMPTLSIYKSSPPHFQTCCRCREASGSETGHRCWVGNLIVSSPASCFYLLYNKYCLDFPIFFLLFLHLFLTLCLPLPPFFLPTVWVLCLWDKRLTGT